MLQPVFTTSFQKDVKRVEKRGYDMEKLKEVIKLIQAFANISQLIIMFIYISDLQFLCQEKNRSRSKNGKQYTET